MCSSQVLKLLIVLDSRGFGLRSSFSLTQQWMTFKIVQLHKECPISTEYSDKATNTAQIFSPKIKYSDIFSGQKGRLWYIWSLWCGKCLKTKMTLWFVMEIIGKFKEDLTFEEDEEEKVCWRGESGIKMRGKRDKRGPKLARLAPKWALCWKYRVDHGPQPSLSLCGLLCDMRVWPHQRQARGAGEL